MFGMGGSTVSDTKTALNTLTAVFDALLKPEQSKALIEEISSKIDELEGVQAQASAAQRDAEAKLAELRAQAAVLANDQAQLKADQVALQQGQDAVTAQSKDVSRREQELAATIKGANADLSARCAKIDDGRASLEALKQKTISDLAAQQDASEARVAKAEQDVAGKQAEAQQFRSSAAKDAAAAADLKAKWQAKVDAINSLAQSVAGA